MKRKQEDGGSNDQKRLKTLDDDDDILKERKNWFAQIQSIEEVNRTFVEDREKLEALINNFGNTMDKFDEESKKRILNGRVWESTLLKRAMYTRITPLILLFLGQGAEPDEDALLLTITLRLSPRVLRAFLSNRKLKYPQHEKNVAFERAFELRDDMLARILVEDGMLYENTDQLRLMFESGETVWMDLIYDAAPSWELGKLILKTVRVGNTIFKSGAEKFIAWLLEKGISPNAAVEKDGGTAFMYAIIANDLRIAYLLLKYGVDTEAKDNEEKTALFFSNTVEMSKFLLENGANVNAQTKFGSTVLHRAVYGGEGDVEMVKLLLSANAKVDARNVGGETALMVAVEFGELQIVEILIAAGADVNAVDYIGRTVLNRARRTVLNRDRKKQTEIVRVLKEAGATK